MPEVTFETDKPLVTKVRKQEFTTIERLVLKTGLVKTKAQVKVVLLLVIVLGIATIVFLNRETGSIGDKYGNYDEILQQEAANLVE